MLEQRPVVSVIVPCYKVTEFIAAALNSLRAQTFRNFEAIVVNDGCPDTENLERALSPYAGEIVYIKQENKGPSSARNTGIRAAGAPLIACLDSDDVWEPDYLETQVGWLQAHPEIDVVYPNATFFGDGANAGKLFTDVLPSRGEVSFRSVVSGQCSVFTGVTARKDSLLRARLYDEDLRWAEDLDLWLRMLHAGARFAYHNKPLVRYRLRERSLGDDRIALARGTVRVYGKLLNELELTEEERHETIAAMRRVGAVIDLMAGKIALYRRNRDAALQSFASANEVLKSGRLRVAMMLLRVWPEPLYRYVHSRYPTEHAYLH